MRGILIICIHVMYKSDSRFYVSTGRICIALDVIELIQALIISNNSSYILVASCRSRECVADDRVAIPCLSYLCITTNDTAHVFFPGYCAVHFTSCYCQTVRIRRGSTPIRASRNTAYIGISFNTTMEIRIRNFAGTHCIIFRTYETAYIIGPSHGCVTNTVLDGTLQFSGKRTNLIFCSRVSDYGSTLNYTVADCSHKPCTTASKPIFAGQNRTDETRF